MNKIFTKVAGVALGLSLAIGVGVGVGTKVAVNRADAATVTTWSRVTSIATLTDGGTFIIGFEGTANSGVIIPMANTGSATTSAAGFMYSGSTASSGGNGTIDMSELGANGSNFEVTIGASSEVSGAIYIRVGENYIGNQNTKNNCKLFTSQSESTSFTPSIGANDALTLDIAANTSGSAYRYFKYNTGSPRFAVYSTAPDKIVAFKKVVQEVSNPLITLSANEKTVKSGGSGTITVTYSSLKGIISVNTSDSAVATASLGSYTYSTDSSVDLTITGVGVGKCTITLSSQDATSKTVSVKVYEEQEFTLIDSATKMLDGGHYLLARTGSSTIMSLTQNSKNRGSTSSTPAGSSDYSTLTTCNSEAAIITITKGTGDYAGYYLLYDPLYEYNSNLGGYLEYYSGFKTYHVNGTPSGDAFYWSLTFDNGHAMFYSKSDTSYSIRFYTGDSVFGAYNTTQTMVDLYLLTSEIPDYKAITNIYAENATVGEGSTIHIEGTYLPVDATEEIKASINDSSLGVLGNISMSDGTFSVSFTGGSVDVDTNAIVTFSNQNGTIYKAINVLVVEYTATHTIVTAASQLNDGSKIVIASQSSEDNTNYSGSAHTNGDYLPTTSTAFNDGKTSLAAAVNTQEFTIWCVDSTKGYYVLSDGGYFLCAPSSQGNKLQRTLILNSRCYFEISDNESGVVLKSVYAAEQEWKYNENIVDYTLQYNYNNGSSPRFALYRAESQKTATLYLSVDSSDNTIQGFIDVFLHMSSYTSNSGYCADSGHHFYDDAKTAFNSLTGSARDAFRTQSQYANAADRLAAWAEANGDEFDTESGMLVAKAHSGFGIIDSNNSMTLITIIAITSLMSFAAFVVLKKKKLHK